MLQKTLNFTYTIRQPPDGKYGALNAYGYWSGIVNEIVQKRADIGKHSFLTNSEVCNDNICLTLISNKSCCRFDLKSSKSSSYIFCFNSLTLQKFTGYKNSYTIHQLPYVSSAFPYLGLGYYFHSIWNCVANFHVFFNKVSITQKSFYFATVNTHLYFGSFRHVKDPEYGEFSCGKSIILSIGALTFRGWSSTPMKTSARIIFFMYVKVTHILLILIAKIFIYY